MKIYTKTGDRGKTSLFSGERVDKHHIRVDAYGDVDELNSAIGLAAAMLTEKQDHHRSPLLRIQSDLFRVGSLLSASEGSPLLEKIHGIDEERIQWLERAMDRMQEDLPALNGFILPGGHRASGAVHVARTVCRRAERRTVSLVRASVGEEGALNRTVAYLNRLSDYLFVLARHCNWCEGVEENLWQG